MTRKTVGRPKLEGLKENEKYKRVMVNLTPKQFSKYDSLGAVKWLRSVLDSEILSG